MPRATGEADDGGRTRDLKLGKLALYQLSYVRVGLILCGLGAAQNAKLVLRYLDSSSSSPFAMHLAVYFTIEDRIPRSNKPK